MVSSDAVVTTDVLDLAGLRTRVDAVLAAVLRHPPFPAGPPTRTGGPPPPGRVPEAVPARRSPGGDELSDALADFVLAPGKRLRPLLCVVGWHAGGGDGPEDRVLRLAASLELFHAFALIHDDVMDGSDTRRGRPSAHRAFAARHAARHGARHDHTTGSHAPEQPDSERYACGRPGGDRHRPAGHAAPGHSAPEHTSHESPGHDRPQHERPEREDPHREPPGHDDPPREHPEREDPRPEAPHRKLPGRQDPRREDPRRGRAEAFGTGAAVLLGDLALIRADQMLHGLRLTPREQRAVLPLLDAMRHEVVHGQYLDLLATGTPGGNVERALTVNRLKTAKYTVERPLHLGAALAGADDAVLRACSAYAIPLGEAFQLRDDLLGAFGDPRVTGKPADEDLRSGKATVLMALAVRRAGPALRARLRRLVGDPGLDAEGAAWVRGVLEETGARDTVERMIADRYGDALDALDRARFPPHVTAVLHRLATATVRRTR